jgi:hypothetical protein
LAKASLKPYEELVIHERQRFVLEETIRLRRTGMQVRSIAPNFQWADGLVMWRETFPKNEAMTKENLDGRGTHRLWAGCSEMLQHQPSFASKETSVTVPVIDRSGKPVFGPAEVAEGAAEGTAAACVRRSN